MATYTVYFYVRDEFSQISQCNFWKREQLDFDNDAKLIDHCFTVIAKSESVCQITAWNVGKLIIEIFKSKKQ
jgi:hypothetical protein